jgi:hypothetical protein
VKHQSTVLSKTYIQAVEKLALYVVRKIVFFIGTVGMAEIFLQIEVHTLDIQPLKNWH